MSSLIPLLIPMVVNALVMLIICSLLGYALLRSRRQGDGIIATLAIILMAQCVWIIPVVMIGEPVFFSLLAGRFCIVNALTSILAVAILSRSVEEVPRQLMDKALLDGCNWFQTYRLILLPFIKRDLVLIVLLILILTIGLFSGNLLLQSLVLTGTTALAGSVIMSLSAAVPVIIIFLIRRRANQL
jgi:multiple sugar transport system permease protein